MPAVGAWVDAGNVSHLRKVRSHVEGTVTQNTLNSTAAITAANGDELTGTTVATLTPNRPDALEIVGVVTITGGTGRSRGPPDPWR